ncbi:MAG: tRNA pseudouridine(55) synthase TruB [Alphaproteobacteria bacterium]
MSRKNKGTARHGWIILDKPPGLTSTQALGKVRHLLDAQKAGHGGTLDPMATGVLPLAFGEATKLIPFVMDGHKTYSCTIGWGESRDTEDAEGQITATSPIRPDRNAILAALPRFIGTIRQTPPIYSALKIDGVRAYDLARAGTAPEMTPRDVQIFDFQLLSIDNPDHASLRIRCGKGTYIRALARDLALALGTVGHLTALRREQSGPFTLQQAISLENLAALAHKGEALTALRPIAAALDDIPAHAIDDQEAHRLRHGQAIAARPDEDGTQFPTMLATHHGQPVALIARRDGHWQPIRGFNL